MEISKNALAETSAILLWLESREPDPQVVATSLMIASAKWVSCLATNDLDLLQRVSSLHSVFTVFARECFEQKVAALRAENEAAQNSLLN